MKGLSVWCNMRARQRTSADVTASSWSFSEPAM